MPDLSVIIPGRNEMFFARTIEQVLASMRGDTDIIAVCDGSWPDPPIQDHPRVTVLHYTDPIGQRAATNQGAIVSRARYMMKLDAHCAVSEGFDVELVRTGDALGPLVTQIPRMYNLHGFDWVCPVGHRRYQSPSGPCAHCEAHQLDYCKHEDCTARCGLPTSRDMIWQPRLARVTDFARFDQTPQYKFWRQYTRTRRHARRSVADVMCAVGACWVMDRERYLALGGLDERHGSWGQVGIEVACKAWLSGGRQVVNKRAWFAHLFRTQGLDFGFPYAMSGQAQERARAHSRWLWLEGHWPLAVRQLSWIVEHFKPVPDWHEGAA